MRTRQFLAAGLVTASVIGGVSMTPALAGLALAEDRVVTGYPAPADAEERDEMRLVDLTVTVPSLPSVANPVAGYEVTVTGGDGETYSAVTDGGGDAVLPGLTQGLWEIEVVAPEGEQDFQSVTANLPLMTMNGSWWYTPEIVLKPAYPDPTPTTVTAPPSTVTTTVQTTTPVTQPAGTPSDPQEPSTPGSSTQQTPSSVTTAIPEPGQPGNQEQAPVRESLPVTGVQIGTLLLIIGALLASGIGLIVSGRKKKDAESSPSGDDGGDNDAGVEAGGDAAQDTESGESR